MAGLGSEMDVVKSVREAHGWSPAMIALQHYRRVADGGTGTESGLIGFETSWARRQRRVIPVSTHRVAIVCCVHFELCIASHETWHLRFTVC